MIENNPVVQEGADVLRKTSPAIPLEDITTDAIQNILHLMKKVLKSQRDGVALAAPQVGISKRIFIVAPKAYDSYTNQHLVFINPKILRTSSDLEWMDEGCLSVRWRYGKTSRYTKATVQAYDEQGNVFQASGSGLLAQVFQHEIDHLDGILFHDHAKDLHVLTDEEQDKVINHYIKPLS
jgi:peptide deformylase